MTRSILIVDPDLDALGTLASELRARGLTVAVADSVDGALERAGRTAPEAILVAASLALDAARALAGQGGLAQIPRFVLLGELPPNALPDLLRRGDADAIAKRLYTLPAKAAAVAVDRGDFRGDLLQVSLPDLLQLLSMNRRTGALSLSTSAGAGEVRVVDGEIVDAVYRRLEGEKALFRLLGEKDGSFSFATCSPSPLRRVQTATRSLLMEGMRQIDEVRRLREGLAAETDALMSIVPPGDDDPDTTRRISEVLNAPRTLEELLDDVPASDLEILTVLDLLLKNGRVRRVPKGAVRVELAEPEQLAVMGAQLKRRARPGYTGPSRIVIVATPQRLSMVMHAVRRISDAVAPAESVPAAPVPHVLATLRLTEGVELDVVGVPALDAYSPLWGLTLPGSAVAVRIDGDAAALESACGVAGVPVLDAVALLGDVDEADPGQMASLIRAALESASA